MSEPQDTTIAIASVEKIQREWQDLKLRVAQLETGNSALEQENKALRQLLERSVEYRKKSHGELVTLLTTIVSKLQLNDVGVLVARLVEHAQHVNEVSAALIHGKSDDGIMQPAILKALDKTKATLRDAIKPLVDELIQLQTPFDHAMLQSLVEKPDNFFKPQDIRASRGFVKGQVPRERILKEFGDEALVFFKDRTTDPKLNPRPKQDEIMLSFLPEFEELLKQHPNAAAAKHDELVTLFHRVRDGRNSRAQKVAFLKLSFVLELLHYYENQSTESPNEVFAQRMPPLIEQMVVTNESDAPDENLVKQAEALLALVINPDHRMAVVNNFGKTGRLSRTARFILTFRAQTFNEHDPVTLEFLKHLLELDKPLHARTFSVPLQLLNKDGQKAVLRCLVNSGRVRREEAEPIAKAAMQELKLDETEVFPKIEGSTGVSGGGWDNVKLLIASRSAPNDITVAIRNRLHQKYDSDEVRQGWLVLAESDPMTLVRVFCLLPYLPDGQTDPIARPVLESFSNRLTHEKYAPTYNKVIGALKNMYKVKADSPALVNFVSIVKWVDPVSAEKIARDIGMNGV
jgi:regulator of replication initiation timing